MQSGTRWAHKPPRGVRLDLSHHWVGELGLKAFYALNSGSGGAIPDLMGNLPLTCTNFGTNNPWSAGLMPALWCNSSTQCAAATVPAPLQLGLPITLAVGVRLLAAPSGNLNLFGLSYSNTGVTPFDAAQMYAGSGGWGILGNSAGSLEFTAGSAFTTGVDYVVSATFSPTAFTLYVNGVQNANLPGSYSNPHYLATSMIAFGVQPGNTVAGTNALFYWGGLWGAAFSATTHRQMFTNPNTIWQIMAPRYNAYIMGGQSLAFNFSGPTNSSVGTPSGNYTVAPSATLTDTVHIASSVPGDTLSASTLNFSASSVAQTLTVTASSLGPRTVTATPTTYPIFGSPVTLNSTVPFTFTGPAHLEQGTAVTLTLTPSTTTFDTITFSDGGKGGTFNPPTLTWVGSSSAKTATYTAATTGAISLTATSTDGASVSGSPLTLTSYNVSVAAYVTKSGKLIIFGTNSTYLTGNVNPIPSPVTAVGSNPTVSVNGSAIQIGAPTWQSSTLDAPFVAYLLECGSVQSLACTNAGTASYTAPAVTWNGDGGGSGLTLGTPVLASGVIAYTVNQPGSSYLTSFATLVPGGTFSQQAYAWVNVQTTTFAITSVSLAGSTATYTGTITGGGSNALVGGTTFTLTQAAISGTTVTYSGTITGGGSNALAGAVITVAGFTSTGNNGAFVVTSSTGTTLVVTNKNGANETNPATAAMNAATITISGFGNSGNNGTYVITASTATTIVVTNAGAVNETHAATSQTGKVTSVVPLTGSALAYGTGYTGTLTGVSLPGSGGLGYSQKDQDWEGAGASGTGLAVACTIGNYIQSVPVTNGGSGFTSPPTFSIFDSGSGAGAAIVPVMSGPLSTDVVTYSASANWLTTKIVSTTNGSQTLASGLVVPPATNAAVTNWVGQLEGPTGRMIGFTAPPSTLFAGTNITEDTIFTSNICFIGKNKLRASQPWFAYNATSVTLDQNRYPTFWSPNTWIYASVYGDNQARGYLAMTNQYQGNWTLQYDDDYYLGGLSAPSYAEITVSAGVNISVVNGPNVTLPTAGAVTIVGGAITAIAIANGGSGIQAAVVTITGNGTLAAYSAVVTNGVVTSLVKIAGGSGYSGTPTVTITPVALSGNTVTITYDIAFANLNIGTDMVLTLWMVSGNDGVCHVHNPWVFAPSNTITRANPFALDDNVVARLTNNGNGPASLRYMGSLGGATDANVVDPGDIMNPNTFSWEAATSWGNTVPMVPPNQPTFTGSTTAGLTTIMNIADTSTLTVGQPIFGNGLPGLFYQPNSAPLTTITQINSPTEITVSVPAKLSGVQSLSGNPSSAGFITFNFARFYSTDPSMATYPWASPKIYSSENWAISGTDSFGPYLDITHGPNGATDNGALVVTGVGSARRYGVVELRSNLPHGLKTGNFCWKLSYGVQQEFGGTTTLNSTSVTVTGGPSLYAGMPITGTGIAGGTTIATVNSPTSITLSQNATASGTVANLITTSVIPWTFSGLLPIGSGFFGPIVVTGPYTVVTLILLENSDATPGFQTVNSTTEVPVYITVYYLGAQPNVPIEYAASSVSNWPNTALHLNIPWVCSDACIAAYAQRVAAYIGKTNPVNIEMGNEHWNDGQDTEPIWEAIQCNLPEYMPSGTRIYPHFTPTRQVSSYTTTGAALTSNDYIYALRAANKHYVFCQAFAAAGGNASLVKLIYGGWWSGSITTGNIVTAVNAYSLPQDYLAIAPYVAVTTDTPLIAAMNPAGFGGNASSGNWPVDAANDFARTYYFYSQTNAGKFGAHAAAMAGTALKLYMYEGAVQDVLQGSPFNDFVNQDSFHHPSYYDVVWCYLVLLQQGSANVANSGIVLSNYFNLIQNGVTGENWKLADSASQGMGRGLSNQYQTPQGGLPGTGNPVGYYQTNVSPGLQAFHDWLGYAVYPVTTPRKPRWFPALNRYR